MVFRIARDGNTDQDAVVLPGTVAGTFRTVMLRTQAVVDVSGQFALGVPASGSAPISTDGPGGGDGGAPAPGENPPDSGLTGSLCGAAGGGTGMVGAMFAPAIAMQYVRRSRRRRPGRLASAV